MKKRDLFFVLKNHLTQDETDILIGSRQTGKTTILKQLVQYLEENGKPVVFLSLEDRDVLEQLDIHPKNLLKFIQITPNQKSYVFLDEVQYLKDPSNFLKLIYDLYQGQIKIIASGSSAFYMDRKFKDSLAGRKKIHRLHPMDFTEFISFKDQSGKLSIELNKIRSNEIYLSSNRRELQLYLDEYLDFGGYPAVVLASNKEDKKAILSELISSYMKRDVIEAGVVKEDIFYKLCKILANQCGTLLNIYELSNTLQVSHTLIENYIFVLRKSFHLHILTPFYKNLRKELTKMPKLYFQDLGLRNILIKQFGEVEFRLDKGQLIENFVFIQLRQKYDTNDLYFWRTTDGNEVDFIISSDYQEGIAYEIKFSINEVKLSKYKKFNTEYPMFKLGFLGYNSEKNSQSLLGL